MIEILTQTAIHYRLIISERRMSIRVISAKVVCLPSQPVQNIRKNGQVDHFSTTAKYYTGVACDQIIISNDSHDLYIILSRMLCGLYRWWVELLRTIASFTDSLGIRYLTNLLCTARVIWGTGYGVSNPIIAFFHTYILGEISLSRENERISIA